MPEQVQHRQTGAEQTPPDPAPGETRVACAQVALRLGEPEHNRAQTSRAVLAAAAAGAKVVVLPELSNSGYLFGSLAALQACAEPLDGPTVQAWARLSAECGVIIVAGLAEADGGAVYNSAVLIEGGEVRARYRKAHLWDREKQDLFTPGAELPPVVDTAVGRLGVMICYDLEFPEWVRHVALRGAQLLCAPVNWPLFPRPTGERPAEVVRVQASASVNRMFIAVADRAGPEEGQAWLGGSVIVDADGYPVTPLHLGDERQVYSDLRLGDALDKRISERNDVHADRRPGLYRPGLYGADRE